MPKTCSFDNCNNRVFSTGYCQSHWRSEIGSKKNYLSGSTNVSNRNISSNKISETKQAKLIPKISQSQLKRLAKYRLVRDVFMGENKVCMARLDGCSYWSVELHHGRGRIGDYLLDDRWFKALCPFCHRACELNPEMAKEIGMSYDRLEKI